jgi:hypothetical protein
MKLWLQMIIDSIITSQCSFGINLGLTVLIGRVHFGGLGLSNLFSLGIKLIYRLVVKNESEIESGGVVMTSLMYV